VELLAELESAVAANPRDVASAVFPYVCLVSASNEVGRAFLRSATKIKRSYEDDWFDYIRRLLIETYRPMSEVLISVPSYPVPKVSIQSKGATQRNELIMNRFRT
jgi:hypothetical protein